MRVYKVGEMVILTDQPIIDLGIGSVNSLQSSLIQKPMKPAPIPGRRKPGRPPGSKTKK